MYRMVCFAAASIGWLAMAHPTVWAHGGEDHAHHGTPEPNIIAPAAMGQRFTLASPDTELVLVLREGQLTAYVDAFASNAPLPDCRLELASRSQTLTLQTDANGVATADAAWLAQPGTYPLSVTALGKGCNDLLHGTLTVESSADAPPAAKPWWQFWLGEAWLPRLAYANGGAEHNHEAPVLPHATGTERPQRLPDGSVFVPKAVQRLWGLRTVQPQTQAVAHTLTLNGTLVADPNASATVQPTQSGRLLPPAEGFPAIGSRVRRGQVLASIEPVAGNLEQGDRQDKLAALRTELALAEKNAQRLASLRGLVPQTEVDAAHNQVATLKARLAALQAHPSNKAETLIAPLDGIVNAANVSVGQHANAGDTLFTILDPSRLQVEALAYDPSLPPQIAQASLTWAGQTLPLRFSGAAQALRQQALPLRFAFANPLATNTLPPVVGQAVQVQVQTSATRQGTPVPAASLLYDSQQQPILWVKEAAEQFKPYVVHGQALDGQHWAVWEGLPPGRARVVTAAAAWLQQVR